MEGKIALKVAISGQAAVAVVLTRQAQMPLLTILEMVETVLAILLREPPLLILAAAGEVLGTLVQVMAQVVLAAVATAVKALAQVALVVWQIEEAVQAAADKTGKAEQAVLA